LKTGRSFGSEECRLISETFLPCYHVMRTLPRRAYKKTAKGTFDDAAYFDGQYASQMAPERPQQSKEERGVDSSSRGSMSTAELDIRNPLRKQSRRQ